MIKAKEVITLDFETYWDKDYTLRKLSTSEYIRDERFKAQCVGIKIGTDNVIWIPDNHVEEALRSIDWSSYALLAHHTQFDGFILTERYGITPAYYLCTLSMGRGLHSIGVGASLDALAQFYNIGNKLPDILEKTKGVLNWWPELMQDAGLYCAVDTQLCYDLFLKMFDSFEMSELNLIDETCRMFCEPVLQVHIPTAQRALTIEQDNKRIKIEKAKTDPANLSSNQKFAVLLEFLGVEVPMKISPTTKKETFAFAKGDAGFQELMIHESEAVRAIVAARIAVKSTIGSTRAQRLIDEGINGRTLPVYLKYYGAHCVPGETEVLTPYGWQRIDQWDGGVIMQATSTQRLEWGPATRFVGPDTKQWLRFQCGYGEFVTTPGHTVPYLADSINNTPMVMQAGELATRTKTKIPVAGFNLGEPYGYTPQQMRFIVMVQADGNINRRPQRRPTIRLRFTKERKILRCRTILIELGIKYTEYKDKNNGAAFAISNREIPAWYELSMKQFGSFLLNSTTAARIAFVEELHHWDGSKGEITYYTSGTKENVDWAQTIAHLCGRPTGMHTCKNGMHRLSLKCQGFYTHGAYAIAKISPDQTKLQKQKAYCPTTKNGQWLARYRGTVFITGNTGRWSGGNKMNLQNLPRIYPDDPDSGLLRKSIIAPDGYVIVVADLAQIEARMLAWLANDLILLAQFASDEDPYKIMATSIFHKSVGEINKSERFVGKTAILGLGYQMGWRRFLLTVTLGLMGPKMPMDAATAQLVVDTYRYNRSKIVAFWGVCTDMLDHMFYDRDMEYGPLRVVGEENRIYMPNNMYLEYPGLSQSNNGYVFFNYENADIMARGGTPNMKRARKIYGGLLAENITQALARIVIGDQLLVVAQRYKVASTTHDELLGVAPVEEADEALEFMIDVMRQPPEWAPDLPLDAEGGFAREYSK